MIQILNLRRGSYNYEQRATITSKMHGGKYLKAEIVRKKGIHIKIVLNINLTNKVIIKI